MGWRHCLKTSAAPPGSPSPAPHPLPEDRPATRSLARGEVPEALTVLRVPAAHRRRLRTTNGLERLNTEIKRRTRVATLFPNEASLLRLASAVLSEISDDWETERAYLTMEAR
ncbi:MAG: transposase [Planctomycetia bacterium]